MCILLRRYWRAFFLALLPALVCAVPPPATWEFDAPEAARRQQDAATTWKVPVTQTLDLGGGITLSATLIPSGMYLRGSNPGELGHQANESPRDMVKITQPFYLGTYEVTQEQFAAVMGYNPSYPSDVATRAQLPVNNVSWLQAMEFCDRMSRRTAQQIGLPTEVQWEAACRAGTLSAYSYGDTVTHAQVNYREALTPMFVLPLLPVGSDPPNAFGLYEMHGNIAEWCSDRYYADAYDPTAPLARDATLGSFTHVLRGGSCLEGALQTRAAWRAEGTDDVRGNGFRVVYLPPPLIPISGTPPVTGELSNAVRARQVLAKVRRVHEQDTRSIRQCSNELEALDDHPQRAIVPPDAQAKPVITAALSDADPRVATCARTAFCFLSTADDASLLVAILAKQSGGVDYGAKEALLEIGAPATAALQQAISNGTIEPDLELLYAVGRRAAQASVLEVLTTHAASPIRYYAFMQALLHNDPSVVELLMKDEQMATLMVGYLQLCPEPLDEGFLPLITDKIDNWKGGRGVCLKLLETNFPADAHAEAIRTRMSLTYHAPQTGPATPLDPDKAKALIAQFTDRLDAPLLRVQAINQVKSLQVKAAVPALLDIAIGPAWQPNAEGRQAAIEALGAIGDPRAKVILEKIHATDPEMRYRGLAREALAGIR
jgi:formylglycine-generating enzyme required for sulfatase activity